MVQEESTLRRHRLTVMRPQNIGYNRVMAIAFVIIGALLLLL